MMSGTEMGEEQDYEVATCLKTERVTEKSTMVNTDSAMLIPELEEKNWL